MRSPATTASPGSGCRPWSNASRPRGRRRSSRTRGGRTPTRGRSSLEVEDQIVRLRKTLTKKGLDAGAETIAAHLADAGVAPVPAVSTIWRILSRRGFVIAQPQKRPRSSWKTFCADQPNERWQADITHWRLADGTEVEILNILDDHSRVCIASIARLIFTGTQVWQVFLAAFGRWGIPAEVLTDNGAVFTGKQRGQGRVALEVQLRAARGPGLPLPALPPADLRQGRTVPPNPEEVAPRATLRRDRWPGCNAS